jgi:hypothetical protein
VNAMSIKRIAMRSNRRQYHSALDGFFSRKVIGTVFWVLFSVLLIPTDYAQETKKHPVPETQPHKTMEALNRYSGASFNPSNRRDPFLNPFQGKKNAKPVEEDEEVSRGAPPPGIGGTYIAQATLQGISVNGTGKMAVLSGADSRAYFLKEGDRLFDGYLKAIRDDSITLVRETRMKSGKLLIQDVIKRLRTP